MTGKIAAIVVAAGKGERAGREGALPKQYREIGGRPMLALAVEGLLAVPEVARLVVVIHASHRALYSDLKLKDERLQAPVTGGPTRQASVLAGLHALEQFAPDLVLIHDAARPYADPALIGRVIAAASEAGGAIPALPIADTVKFAPEGRLVQSTPDRASLFTAQTPQAFSFRPILDAHRKAAAEAADKFTDDASIAEWAGMEVRIVEGDRRNAKITFAEDFAAPADARRETRTGTGYDVHAFGPGDQVMLGGVAIPHDNALLGHSDSDVALHAITDALLGALADGDIGRHFPPSDPKWKGADSAVFLDHAAKRVHARGGRILNLDVTIICEAPKIAPHADAMRERIAGIAGIALARVSIKATTTEELGFTGRREGIAAQAIATIELPADA